nr:hypothetical protein [Tanacetum cinerariifolium]
MEILPELTSNSYADQTMAYNLTPAESKFKTATLDHQDKYIMKVQDSDSLMEEINLSFTPDDPIPPDIEDDDYESGRDILILDELLSSYSLSVPENESFHFDIPSSSCPPAKPPDGNSGILNVKVMGDIFEHNFPMPRLCSPNPHFSKIRRNLLISYLIKAMKLLRFLLNA